MGIDISIVAVSDPVRGFSMNLRIYSFHNELTANTPILLMANTPIVLTFDTYTYAPRWPSVHPLMLFDARHCCQTYDMVDRCRCRPMPTGISYSVMYECIMIHGVECRRIVQGCDGMGVDGADGCDGRG